MRSPAPTDAGRLRPAARLLATLVLVAALALLACVLTGVATGRWRAMPILSGSMAPAYPRGSLVLVTPEPVARLRSGMVISFRSPLGDHHLMTHRVVRVVDRSAAAVLTKGDANQALDPWTLRLHGTRIWVVRGGVPYLGYPAVYGRRALALTLVLGTVGGASGFLLRRIWRRPALGPLEGAGSAAPVP